MYEVITMTEMARRQFETERVEQKLSDQAGLRVRFAGMGWGGPRLMLALDELIQKDDNVVDIDGIKIAYEPGLERYMQDSMVDYARIKGYFVKVRRRLRC